MWERECAVLRAVFWEMTLPVCVWTFGKYDCVCNFYLECVRLCVLLLRDAGDWISIQASMSVCRRLADERTQTHAHKESYTLQSISHILSLTGTHTLLSLWRPAIYIILMQLNNPMPQVNLTLSLSLVTQRKHFCGKSNFSHQDHPSNENQTECIVPTKLLKHVHTHYNKTHTHSNVIYPLQRICVFVCAKTFHFNHFFMDLSNIMLIVKCKKLSKVILTSRQTSSSS